MYRSMTLLALASTASLLHAVDAPVWPAAYKHVLILTIDGFREADLEDSHLAADLPNIRALQLAGITYTNAACPAPTDSFPGLLGIMTGANPKTTGVYFDESYSRALYPPGTTLDGSGSPSNPIGSRVPWTEAITYNNGTWNLNGTMTPNTAFAPPLAATGYDATSIDPALLPRKLNGSGPTATLTPFYPHQYLKVNTIFEVAHAAGLRTAWSDKHPSYEVLNGPSGAGLDDLFAPESEAKETAQVPSNRITGLWQLKDDAASGAKPSKSQGASIGEDDLRVLALLNQLQGLTSKGAAVAGNTVPALFGMNFIAVNSSQKFDTTAGSQPKNSLTTGSQLNGGIAADGTVSANLHEAIAHTDASIGKIITALKNTTDVDGRTLYDNTLVVITAKHGNTPRLGQAVVIPVDWYAPGINGAKQVNPTNFNSSIFYGAASTNPYSAAAITDGPLGGPTVVVSQVTEDAAALFWLAPGMSVATAVANLNTFAGYNATSGPNGGPLIDSVYSGAQIPTLYAGLGDPTTDDRAPDIIVKFKPGVIAATSNKRAEHGGFTTEESQVPLVLAGGLPSAVRGTAQSASVSTTQIAPTALIALGLDAGALQGAKAEATATLPGAVDNAPVAVSDSLLAKQDRILVVPSSILSRNDTDADGDPLLVTGVSPTTTHGGTVSLADGKVIYTPPAGYTGPDSFTYTVRDGARVSGRVPTGDLLGYADPAHTVPVYHSGYGSAGVPVPGTTNEYYLLTDRGPNADPNPGVTVTDPLGKIFANPAFHPEIAHVRWNADGSISLLGVTTLKNDTGTPLSGLPNPSVNGQIIDVGYTVDGVATTPDPTGIDSEGLVALADGTFWVSDEYGPWLVHFAANGNTLERIGPFAANAQGHKLPAVLQNRLINKGMEGLCITPDGSLLVGLMQSALVNPTSDTNLNTNNGKCLLMRLVTYRLVAGGGEAVGKCHQYAYIQTTGNASEITALSNTEFLVDERNGNFPSDTQSTAKKSFWRCSIAGATDIDDPVTPDSLNGWTITSKTLEQLVYNQNFATTVSTLTTNGITPVSKNATVTLDLVATKLGLAYDHDKVEGLYYANGRLFISNDDDFAVNGSLRKVIPGSYPVGNSLLLSEANQVLAAGSAGNPGTSPVLDGKVADYGQLLEVDPNKLLSDTGIVNVTVAAAGNTPPTIVDVTDKSTRFSTATPAIDVLIGDTETPAANLVLSASSSNLAIVLDSGITLGGSGANRTVTVTPVSGVIGNTTITLTVTDAMGFSASDTFVLTVTDSAPVASNGGFTVAASATATGSLTVVDSDGGSTALVYSLVSAPTKGTVTITAATGAFSYTANAGVTGTDTFTFKANDGLMDSNVASETVTFGSGATPPPSSSSSSSSSCGLGSGVSTLLSLALTALVALSLRRCSANRHP